MRAVVVIVSVAILSACGDVRSKRPSVASNSPNNTNNATTGPNNTSNNETNNTTVAPVCGDGVVDSGELCDGDSGPGACPMSCQAPACAVVTLTGAAATCDAECTVEPVGCIDGDGCCSVGCDANSDSDCSNVCGNGVVEENELCDGMCPTTCGTPNACTLVELVGDPNTCSSRCEARQVQICQSGDGCCPPSCNANNDGDCGASCGNGTVEPGETCDGNCPTTCDDGLACTRDTVAGNPGTCNVVCQSQQILSCQGGDGCCPDGCTRTNDSDCSATCGDGVVDPGEFCDGNCPTSCNDGVACTRDSLRGSASSCTARCAYPPITVCQGGDGCCPDGCSSSNDSDCSCQPDSCMDLGIECGPANNGCGGTIQCGTCATGMCTNGMCEDGGGTNSVVGQPCMSDADCPDMVNADPYCLQSTDGWPGGYCTAPCQGICADFVSVCSSDLLIIGSCLQGCTGDGDCRTGYVCETQVTILGDLNACVPR